MSALCAWFDHHWVTYPKPGTMLCSRCGIVRPR